MNHSRISRRQFVAGTAAAAVLGTIPLGQRQYVAAAPAFQNIPVGVQLWTLRKETAEDLAGTLRKVSQIGYQGVELWFQKWPAANELKKLLDDGGLKVASAHVNLKDLVDDFARLADYHRTIGNQTLVIPYVPNFAKFTPDDWRKTVADIQHVARVGTEAGFTMLYHNHDFEFTTRVGDVEVLDLIFGSIDAKWLGAEIDVFFVADVGRDPATILKKFSGRLKRVHLKEKSKPGDPFKQTELGGGVIDWPAVLKAAAAAGTEWFLVEQNCENRPALESIQISYDFLKKTLAASGG